VISLAVTVLWVPKFELNILKKNIWVKHPPPLETISLYSPSSLKVKLETFEESGISAQQDSSSSGHIEFSCSQLLFCHINVLSGVSAVIITPELNSTDESVPHKKNSEICFPLKAPESQVTTLSAIPTKGSVIESSRTTVIISTTGVHPKSSPPDFTTSYSPTWSIIISWVVSGITVPLKVHS